MIRKVWKAFKKTEQLLWKYSLSDLYDVNKDIVLICDASDKNVGSALCHIIEDKGKTIVFASRILNETKINYTILYKEASSVMFEFTEIHQRLARKLFKIITEIV